jgi:hypothetical protein
MRFQIAAHDQRAVKRVIPQLLRTAESAGGIRSIQIAVIGPRAWMSPGTIREASTANGPRTASVPLMLSGPMTSGSAYAGAKKPKYAREPRLPRYSRQPR